MKKLIFVLLTVLVVLPLSAQTTKNLTYDDPIYTFLDKCYTKGWLYNLPDVKPYTEKRAMERKNNPKANKPKKEKNPDFVVVDEEEDVKLDYTGFVPDYSNKKDDMSFYTSRTEIDYSKYRKGGAQGSSDDSSNSLASLTGTLRSTNSYELNKLFSVEAVKGSAQPKDFTALKSTNFVLALTGGQLNSLFTSWLITNCTKTTAKQFEKGERPPAGGFLDAQAPGQKPSGAGFVRRGGTTE